MYTTITQHLRDLQAKKYSCYELTEYYLQRIAQNHNLNSFITLTPEIALETARNYDKNPASGSLAGIPIAHKDILCTKGVKTTCASKILSNFIAPYNATVIEKLNAAGTLMVGKTNMDEFAMGSSNENSFYGPVRNPWNLDCVPGGSSGGSAAAIAARLIPAALGTETGGSIRQPAALCGITGLKTTYGLVSRFGLIAFASSLDQAGPMAQTAEDCALLLAEMAGHDPRDSTSAPRPVPNYRKDLSNPLAGLRVGILKEFFSSDLDPHIAKPVMAALEVLKKAGVQIKEVSIPHIKLSIPIYYIIAPAECSSNLARFDGVRYGYRCENPRDLTDLYQRTRGEGFGSEVKRRILIGTYVLSAGYYSAYYVKAQQIRRILAQDWAQAFKEVDVIFTPATPNTAFKIGEKTTDPVSMYLQDIYNAGVNLAGLPALSMPVGFHNGLPIGAQLIGNYFCEGQILNVAHQFQLLTDWHTKTPPGY